MAIAKTMVAPNGAPVSYHRILKLESSTSPDTLTVAIGSWHNQDGYIAASVAPVWTFYATVTLTTVSGQLLDAVEDLLLLNSDFAGGTKIPSTAGEGVSAAGARKWAFIKSQRSALEFGGFTWDGSAFDSDPQAQARIQGGVQLATIAAAQSQPFSIDWTLADNTVRTLSGADMIAVGMTLAAHVQTVHAIARALRLQIEAATTLAEVEAVVWP